MTGHHIGRLYGGSIKAIYDGSVLSGSKMTKDEKIKYWRYFYQRVEYDMDLAEELFYMWHSKFCDLLKGLVYREKHTSPETEIPYLSSAARERMRAAREDPQYQARVAAYTANRNKHPDRSVHYGGSEPSSKYLKKIANETGAASVADVFVHYRCKEDKEGNMYWNDPLSGQIYDKFQTEVQAAGVDTHSIEANNIYYNVAGGFNVKNQSVYGLGSATGQFYTRPARSAQTQGQGSSSSSSTPMPAPFAVLVSENTALKARFESQNELLTQMSEECLKWSNS